MEKCKCNKNTAQDEHICPFKYEIHDDESMCDCCEDCQEDCAGDI